MNVYYYIYCNGVLGVETNIADFKWIYGSVAPAATKKEYDKCDVKFEINLTHEKELSEYRADDRFQSYYWNAEAHTISCRRTVLGKIKIGYNISLGEDKIVAEIGRNYYKFVNIRIMNLHGVYYLLSDLANILLLRKGYLTLYASAIYCEPLNKGIVCFGAPNMGKTLTATKLCEKEQYRLVGEDVVIAKGKTLFACPWTASFRKKRSNFDSAGAFGRTVAQSSYEICQTCEATDLMALTAGENRTSGRQAFLNKISMMNGYLFNYCATPIVKILGYFDETYCQDWYKRATAYLEQLLDRCQYNFVYADDPTQYSSLVDNLVMGGTQ